MHGDGRSHEVHICVCMPLDPTSPPVHVLWLAELHRDAVAYLGQCQPLARSGQATPTLHVLPSSVCKRVVDRSVRHRLCRA